MADTPISMRASLYYIQGEDVARAGGNLADCGYYAGSIAYAEWMAGFSEAAGEQLVLTSEMETDEI